jgi:hypothetical protein
LIKKTLYSDGSLTLGFGLSNTTSLSSGFVIGGFDSARSSVFFFGVLFSQ